MKARQTPNCFPYVFRLSPLALKTTPHRCSHNAPVGLNSIQNP
jgi:hypothetical protein